jgi:Ulp1 family protease
MQHDKRKNHSLRRCASPFIRLLRYQHSEKLAQQRICMRNSFVTHSLKKCKDGGQNPHTPNYSTHSIQFTPTVAGKQGTDPMLFT